jgi:hypothetical protein
MWDPTFEERIDEDGEIWGDYIPVGDERPACPFCDAPFCEYCEPTWPDMDEAQEEVQEEIA